MKIIDLHQDLMSHLRFRRVFGQSEQTSFDEIAKSDLDLVVATAFPMPVDNDQTNPVVKKLITEELKMYRDFAEQDETWLVIDKKSDLDDDRNKLLLHVEGLNVFTGGDSDWQLLEDWRALGLRSVATHWNINNELGGGTLDPESSLTRLGREVIQYLEENNLLFDMSHMGRKTFFDTAAVVKRPIYVSHGNADALCKDLRNYTDEQLQIIAKSDGLIGVFFAGKFVTQPTSAASLEKVVDHIDYLKKNIGVSYIGIGSDFGGIISGTAKNLAAVGELPNLVTELEKRHYPADEIDSILYKNARRVIESHLD